METPQPLHRPLHLLLHRHPHQRAVGRTSQRLAGRVSSLPGRRVLRRSILWHRLRSSPWSALHLQRTYAACAAGSVPTASASFPCRLTQTAHLHTTCPVTGARFATTTSHHLRPTEAEVAAAQRQQGTNSDGTAAAPAANKDDFFGISYQSRKVKKQQDAGYTLPSGPAFADERDFERELAKSEIAVRMRGVWGAVGAHAAV